MNIQQRCDLAEYMLKNDKVNPDEYIKIIEGNESDQLQQKIESQKLLLQSRKDNLFLDPPVYNSIESFMEIENTIKELTIKLGKLKMQGK